MSRCPAGVLGLGNRRASTLRSSAAREGETTGRSRGNADHRRDGGGVFLVLRSSFLVLGSWFLVGRGSGAAREGDIRGSEGGNFGFSEARVSEESGGSRPPGAMATLGLGQPQSQPNRSARGRTDGAPFIVRGAADPPGADTDAALVETPPQRSRPSGLRNSEPPASASLRLSTFCFLLSAFLPPYLPLQKSTVWMVLRTTAASRRSEKFRM
jgi:hypothetical protein